MADQCPTCGSKDAPRVCCPGTHAPDDHDSTCEPCWDPWHAATPALRCPYFSRAWGVQCDRPVGHDGNCQSGGDGFAPGYTPTTPEPRDVWQHDETGRIVELPAGSPSPGKRYYRVRGMGGDVSVVGRGDEARVVFTPAPRDEAHGEVVLWRYGTELFDTRRPPPEVEHYEYIAVPAAQRERERALIEAAVAYVDAKGAPDRTRTGIALGEAIAALRRSDYDTLPRERAESETLRRLLFRALDILDDEGFTVFPDEARATIAALRRGEHKED